MKATTIVMVVLLCLAGASLCVAADPHIGTWKLNEAKSKIPAGTVKNTLVKYEVVGDKVKVTVDGVEADGKKVHSEWTGKYDGKDYPATGDPSIDSRAYTKVDDHTLALTNKKGGKVVTTARIAVAADGKSRTVSMNGTDAHGMKITGTAVYDKQ